MIYNQKEPQNHCFHFQGDRTNDYLYYCFSSYCFDCRRNIPGASHCSNPGSILLNLRYIAYFESAEAWEEVIVKFKSIIERLYSYKQIPFLVHPLMNVYGNPMFHHFHQAKEFFQNHAV